MHNKYLFGIVLSCTILAGCGGGGGSNPVPSNNNNGAIPPVTQPTAHPVVVTPTPLVTATPVANIFQSAVAPQPFSPANSLPLQSVRRIQSNNNNAPNYATWWIFVLYTNNGLYAINSFDPNLSLTAGNTLYAPTMKLQNECLEMTTYYISGTSGVFIWDWCSSNEIAGNWTVKFLSYQNGQLNNYLRNLGNGYPEYTGEIYRDSVGYWHAIMYNFATSNWDDIYNTNNGEAQVDNVPGGANNPGWDMYEQHYANGSYCPDTGSIGSRNIQLMNGIRWSVIPLAQIYDAQIQTPSSDTTINPCLSWPWPEVGVITSGYVPPGKYTFTSNSWLAHTP